GPALRLRPLAVVVLAIPVHPRRAFSGEHPPFHCPLPARASADQSHLAIQPSHGYLLVRTARWAGASSASRRTTATGFAVWIPHRGLGCSGSAGEAGEIRLRWRPGPPPSRRHVPRRIKARRDAHGIRAVLPHAARRG